MTISLANVDLPKRGLINKGHDRSKSERELIVFSKSLDKKKRIWDILRQIPSSYPSEEMEKHRPIPNIIVFPEVNIPIEWLPSLAWFSRKKQVFIITGVEYHKINNQKPEKVVNSIATIIPTITSNGFPLSSIFLREKNFYAPEEKKRIEQNGFSYKENLDDPLNFLFRWRGLRFSSYVCYELTDVTFRSMFRGDIDLLIGVEWNKDVSYFSNIAESIARDLNIYVAQVNDSTKGGTRIIAPKHGYKANVMSINGGTKDIAVTSTIDIGSLRTFNQTGIPEKVKNLMNKKTRTLLNCQNKEVDRFDFTEKSANSNKKNK